MKAPLSKQMFRKAWAQGVATKEITMALGISRRTACYWRKELGLRTRKSS
jgi:hypothetical protein